MKKIVTIMFIMLMSVISLQAKHRDPYHFVVEGEFLAEKNINYTVFKEATSGKFVAIEHTKARKYYRVECNTGEKYIIRFQNKKGDTKFLMIDAVQSGYFIADVDWRKPYDAKIILEKIGYCLIPLTNMTKLALLAQK